MFVSISAFDWNHWSCIDNAHKWRLSFKRAYDQNGAWNRNRTKLKPTVDEVRLFPTLCRKAVVVVGSFVLVFDNNNKMFVQTTFVQTNHFTNANKHKPPKQNKKRLKQRAWLFRIPVLITRLVAWQNIVVWIQKSPQNVIKTSTQLTQFIRALILLFFS